ncbi:MAG: class I SAM-dependent methyltransferase, partial [Desulfobaccales bacterium]
MEHRFNNNYDHYYAQIIDVFTELDYPQNFIGQWILPQSDGKAIVSLIQECQPRNILEVGTFVGMTTLLMALITSPETHTHTIDPNFPLRLEMESMRSKLYDSDAEIRAQELALKAARRLGIEQRITFHAGGFSTDNTFASYNTSPESRIQVVGPEVCAQHGPFDFIFIDGLHYEDDVFADLTLAAQHLAPGGVIAVHDVIGRWASNVRRAVFRFLETRDTFSFSHDAYTRLSHSIGVLRQAPPPSPCDLRQVDLAKGSLVNERLFPNLAAVLVTRFAPGSVIQIGGDPAFLKTMKNFG